MATKKMTKNQLRRAKKKEQKKSHAEAEAPTEAQNHHDNTQDGAPSPPTSGVHEDTSDANEAEISIDVEKPAFDDDGFADNPALASYKDIFAKFGATLLGKGEDDDAVRKANAGNQGTVFFDEDDEIPDEEQAVVNQTLSKKKRKQQNRLSVAELKATVKHPEVIEWCDASSSDPRLLVQIKAHRNIVPVPSHWALKREYLSTKRGIEKAPFRLPDFIADTGIAEMRDAVLEKEAEQTLKQKQRARVQPKMGKLDIDYQRLYDAFFRFQTKPELTRYGEVYYEGKEAEVDYHQFRPGDLTDAAKEALGMPPGAPPPWLINQQRTGPPPSYPTLKIPGLNVPPPPGGTWGFHPGGWGKPPIDEMNRPLYGGDVFGLSNQPAVQPQPAQAEVAAWEPVERTLWGELQPREQESEDEEEDEEDEEDDDEGDQDQDVDEMPDAIRTEEISDLGKPSSFPAGSGVEASISGENGAADVPSGRAAYTVIQEQKVQGSSGLFGVGHQYDLSSAQRPGMPVLGSEEESRKRKKPGDVDVALDVDSLNQHDGISKEAVRQKFEEGRKHEGVGAQWQHDEDLADMIAEESRKRQKTERDRQERRRDGRSRH